VTTSTVEPGLARFSPTAAFVGLFRWYRPYLAGMRGLIGWTIVGTLVFLACAAVTPLLVEWILHHGTWDTRAIVGLIAIVVLQLVVSYYAHIGAHRIASESASKLRLAVFDRALASRISRQQVLDRSSIVSRHADDVDRVSEAVEKTLAEGLPGIVRVLQSLILLTVIEPIAGIAMTLATIAFLLIHRRIGRHLLRADHERTQAASDVATLTDETISTSRLLTGLHLGRWQRERFARRVARLEHATHEQGVQVSRLIVGAHTAGLVGLVVITIGAVALGGESLAGVAAAILYVESVVLGLEALPPWVRSVQLGVVSQQRIDMILNEDERIDRPEPGDRGGLVPGLAAHGLELRLESGQTLRDGQLEVPPGTVLGVVSSPWPLADGLVAALAGDDNPVAGAVTLDGVDVRSPSVQGQLAYVPDETAGFDVSAIDELRAADPALSVEGAHALLARFGLSHIADSTRDLDVAMGPGGNLLAVSDRQLLNLTVAVASRPRVLLAGSLIPLGEADVALPILTALRAEGYQATVLSVRDPVVAEAVDLIAFLDGSTLRTGTHQELLVSSPGYARMWEQRLTGADVDLSVLGLSPDDEAGIHTRLVTESYAAGDPVYRQGAPADRILFIISGQAAVTVTDREGRERRTAVLGPGNHCGDLSLTVGETRAESVWAVTPLVVRSLSREAITAGLTGLLDRTATERRIVTSILRSGPGTADELRERLPDVTPRLFDSSLALLVKDGAVRESGGVLSAVQRRQAKAGAAALLDRLGDL
jgi:ABC-type multidrug transport system fused ATPase/permease subunit/CRP-like cAMP-binding protein